MEAPHEYDVGDTHVTVIWSAATNAIAYEVQYAQQVSGSDPGMRALNVLNL